MVVLIVQFQVDDSILVVGQELSLYNKRATMAISCRWLD